MLVSLGIEGALRGGRVWEKEGFAWGGVAYLGEEGGPYGFDIGDFGGVDEGQEFVGLEV